MNDAVLVEETAEFLRLLASHAEGCRVLEEVEASRVEGHDMDEVQRNIIASGRSWRAALLHIGRSAAFTDDGILAKCSAIQGYLAEYPAEDVGLMALINSLVGDLKRRLATPDI